MNWEVPLIVRVLWDKWYGMKLITIAARHQTIISDQIFLKCCLYIIYNAHIYLHALYKLRIFTLIFRLDLFKIISQFSLGYCCCYHSKTSIAIIEHVIKNNQVCKLLNDGKQVITEFCYVLSMNLCLYFEYWSYNKQFTFRNNKTKIS